MYDVHRSERPNGACRVGPRLGSPHSTPNGEVGRSRRIAVGMDHGTWTVGREAGQPFPSIATNWSGSGTIAGPRRPSVWTASQVSSSSHEPLPLHAPSTHDALFKHAAPRPVSFSSSASNSLSYIFHLPSQESLRYTLHHTPSALSLPHSKH